MEIRQIRHLAPNVLIDSARSLLRDGTSGLGGLRSSLRELASEGVLSGGRQSARQQELLAAYAGQQLVVERTFRDAASLAAYGVDPLASARSAGMRVNVGLLERGERLFDHAVAGELLAQSLRVEPGVAVSRASLRSSIAAIDDASRSLRLLLKQQR